MVNRARSPAGMQRLFLNRTLFCGLMLAMLPGCAVLSGGDKSANGQVSTHVPVTIGGLPDDLRPGAERAIAIVPNVRRTDHGTPRAQDRYSEGVLQPILSSRKPEPRSASAPA